MSNASAPIAPERDATSDVSDVTVDLTVDDAISFVRDTTVVRTREEQHERDRLFLRVRLTARSYAEAFCMLLNAHIASVGMCRAHGGEVYDGGADSAAIASAAGAVAVGPRRGGGGGAPMESSDLPSAAMEETLGRRGDDGACSEISAVSDASDDLEDIFMERQWIEKLCGQTQSETQPSAYAMRWGMGDL